VQTEHAQYFEALQKHPRLLVGVEVPVLDGEGMETLKDADDAKDWQEALKVILVDEIRDRASVAMDENADFLNTISASIELFQKNPDLVPGTKEFDVDLANRFADLATPYELRVEGKLQGYSIPVQPIIEQIRTQLVAERAKAAENPPEAAKAGGTPAPAAGAESPMPPAPADPPQAGIQSKAGSGDNKEDFSVLFGTIGLPDLQI
jgi:hypothetical protein